MHGNTIVHHFVVNYYIDILHRKTPCLLPFRAIIRDHPLWSGMIPTGSNFLPSGHLVWQEGSSIHRDWYPLVLSAGCSYSGPVWGGGMATGGMASEHYFCNRDVLKYFIFNYITFCIFPKLPCTSGAWKVLG